MSPSANGNGNGNGHVHDHDPCEPPAHAPPHNLEAEKGVLGGMMLDNATIATVRAILEPDDFFRDAHQVLFAAIVAIHDRGSPADPILVAEELGRRGRWREVGGDGFLAEVLDAVAHAANTGYYAEIVRQKAIARALIEGADAIRSDGYSDRFTTEELLARAGSRIDLSRGAPDDDGIHVLRPWPDAPDPAVWHGLAGKIIGLVAPHTEADPMAILAQFLVGVGNLVGRGPHWSVEATRHGCNLFLCLVGNSAMARKGTSWDHVRRLLGGQDPEWEKEHIRGGLSSGEGLIWSVRDPILRREKTGKTLYDEVEVDPGVRDKRALFVETEFGTTLAVLGREGNSLNGYLRQAFDSGTFRAETKNNPARTTDAHISVIGHITGEELHWRLSQNDIANGFANRFLWLCARRSQYLPHGGRIQDVDFGDVFRRLHEAIAFAREAGDLLLRRDGPADALWEDSYRGLTEPRPGLLGSVTIRAAALTMRLASIYALLDRSAWIGVQHLRAGLALWRYCDQSAGYIFGDALGNPDAEKLLGALREAGDAGLSRSQIHRKVFGGHRPAEAVGATITLLYRNGLIRQEIVTTRGKPATTWVLARDSEGAQKAQ